MQGEIKRIVFTGGDAGGKTLGIAEVQEKLKILSWRAFIVHEAATLVISGGVYDMGRIAKEEPGLFFEIQKTICALQISFEDEVFRMAQKFPEGKKVILCDRGLLDQLGYVETQTLFKILGERGFILDEVIGRYDAVMHMVTAADGAEEFYSSETNKARYKTPEEARELDRRLRLAWARHPQRFIFDNSTDFEGKKARLLRVVCDVLEIPEEERPKVL